MSIFRLLSAILHLGNIAIDQLDDESTSIRDGDRSCATFCSLLKIDEPRMRIWLCNKRIKTGIEVVNTTLNLSQVSLVAVDRRASPVTRRRPMSF
jgi:myosin V